MHYKTILILATTSVVSARSVHSIKRSDPVSTTNSTAWPDPPYIPYISPPPGWINAGCYSDSWNRTLADSVSVSGPFSRDSCIAACDSAGYAYAGVENGNECYCSNIVASTGLKTSDADCLMPCVDNTAQSCGGGWRINIFQSENHATLNWPPSGWSSLGCYTDSWTRTLAGSNYTYNNMASTTDCIFTCLSTGYKFAGIENGNECYCSNAVATTGTPASGADCSTPCAGYPANKCGGPWRLDIYWNNYWKNSTTTTS